MSGIIRQDGNGRNLCAGHLAELESSAWKDDRRFRLLVADRGALSFSDLYLNTPSKAGYILRISECGDRASLGCAVYLCLQSSPAGSRSQRPAACRRNLGQQLGYCCSKARLPRPWPPRCTSLTDHSCGGNAGETTAAAGRTPGGGRPAAQGAGPHPCRLQHRVHRSVLTSRLLQSPDSKVCMAKPQRCSMHVELHGGHCSRPANSLHAVRCELSREIWHFGLIRTDQCSKQGLMNS